MTTPPPTRRRTRGRRLTALILAFGVLAVSACTLSLVRTNRPLAEYPASPQAAEGKFRNVAPRPPQGVGFMARLLWDFAFHKPATTVPDAPPVVLPLTREALEAAPDRSLFRLGHSTLLIKLRGGFWITDPVFAERASPLQWMGPKRFHAPPIALEALPPLRGVLLSHDHYDHLDRATVAALAGKTEVFLAPLGVGDRLVAWGVPEAKVRQFDWWQETELDGLRIIATPAQHFSGRGLFDGDRTLWTSWVVIDPPAGEDDHGLRLFFSGDTGYFDGFREIGRRFGPFDVAMLETGAYDLRWTYVHMLPEQTVQAHADLRARVLLPIHNGTFDLAMHAWNDPFERIAALAAERGAALATPRMGERFDLAAPQPTPAWWRE
ncbi:MBL fold metallo-hydrolase [Luteimonas sp. SJ-92]|uniref:MBL fold metallo-hydrolase n=1 Tax=Luteimonas salinisoli TaxID=2752307 RepID=A0A853JFI1_9GAMM|nr:MBL fold metallo-hydrolase [Luteimonas salinisoli]NZA27238.1 MBL fold metallo-hydrolase [Luteimonas salinisoli]